MATTGNAVTRTVAAQNHGGGRKAVQVIKGMTQSAQNLHVASSQLQSQSKILSNLPVKSEDPLQELQRLRQLLQQHDVEHTKKMQDMKRLLQEEIETGSVEILKEVRGELRSIIEDEVKAEVDAQIREHIPVPLSQQAEETKEQLRIVNASLQNSRSRIANAGLGVSNLFDSLAVVLTPQGTRSKWWPADLGSLFAYDLESARLLVKDFGLVDSDQLHVNFQRFLAHIGTDAEQFLPSVKD